MSSILRDTNNKTTTPVSKLMRGVGELSVNHACRSLSSGKNNAQNISMSSTRQKGLRRREITPTRNHNFSTGFQGDRYINIRMTDDELDFANHVITSNSFAANTALNNSSSAPTSPLRESPGDALRKVMRTKSAGHLGLNGEERILAYKKNCAPAAPVGHMSQAKVLYSAHCLQPSSSVKKSSRFIPTTAERILDAPELRDDFYSNLMDWSRYGILAIALSFSVYLWNAETGEVLALFELDCSNDLNMITAVKWSKDGRHLTIGLKDGSIRVYDPERQNASTELRTMKIPVPSQCSVLSWRDAMVSGGYHAGQIVHHDVRTKNHVVGSFNGHRQPVVGMEWSFDERLLCSGSGDTTVKLWDHCSMSTTTSRSLHDLTEHTGSVRAVKFCNFKSSLLATGGGSNDCTVKLWNVHSGELLKSIKTESAVNCIQFNSDYKEMATAHFDGQLVIWKYPTYQQIGNLAAHSPYRLLEFVSSPCGQYVMTAGGDESLKLWHLFKVDKSTETLLQRKKILGHTIR